MLHCLRNCNNFLTPMRDKQCTSWRYPLHPLWCPSTNSREGIYISKGYLVPNPAIPLPCKNWRLNVVHWIMAPNVSTQNLRMWRCLESIWRQLVTLKWGQTGLGRAINPMNGFSKKKAMWSHTETLRGEKVVGRWGQRLEWCSYKPRKCTNLWQLPEATKRQGCFSWVF